MEELFELIEVLKELGDKASEAPPPSAGWRESAESSCSYYEVSRESAPPPGDVHGLDSHTAVVEFEGASAIVATGALVGRSSAVVPGAPAKWLGVRLNFRGGAEQLAGSRLYFKSEILGRPFDAYFDIEAARDEMRYHVEEVLARSWDGSGVLLVDGPVFRALDVLQRGGDYAVLYGELARRRAEILAGRRAVGVVKRVDQSAYLARCVGFGSDDEVVARRLLDNSPGFVGPVEVRWGDMAKYLYYVGAPSAKGIRVLRVEAFDPDLAREAASWMGSMADAAGIPVPIQIADRLARRLNAAAVKLLYAASPVEPTYRGLEAVAAALKEL
ncbi:MAG: DNA double-strand break repair nuclease NurA [Thermoproteus sp.]